MRDKLIVAIEEREGCLTVAGEKAQYWTPAHNFVVVASELAVTYSGGTIDSRFHASSEVSYRLIAEAARIQDGHLSIIGRNEIRTDTLTLTILPFDAFTDGRDKDKQADAGADTSVKEWSAHVGFLAGDREYDSADTWLGRLVVPTAVFTELVRCVREGRFGSLTTHMGLQQMYSDDHPYAPSIGPFNWFLRPSIPDGDANSPELAEGMAQISVVEAPKPIVSAAADRALKFDTGTHPSTPDASESPGATGNKGARLKAFNGVARAIKLLAGAMVLVAMALLFRH